MPLMQPAQQKKPGKTRPPRSLATQRLALGWHEKSLSLKGLARASATCLTCVPCLLTTTAKAERRAGAEQHHLRGQRENRVEVGGRQVGEALGLPIGDQAVRRDDAAALHAVFADADFGSRVAPDQVGARARFERELHSALPYRRCARSSS